MEEEIKSDITNHRRSIKKPMSERASFSIIVADESNSTHNPDESSRRRDSSTQETTRKRSLVGKQVNLKTSSQVAANDEKDEKDEYATVLDRLPEVDFEESLNLAFSSQSDDDSKSKERVSPLPTESNLRYNGQRNSISQESAGHRRTSRTSRIEPNDILTSLDTFDDGKEFPRHSVNSRRSSRRSSAVIEREERKVFSRSSTTGARASQHFEVQQVTQMSLDTFLDNKGDYDEFEAFYLKGKEKLSLDSIRPRRQSKQSSFQPLVEVKEALTNSVNIDSIPDAQKSITQKSTQLKKKDSHIESPNGSLNGDSIGHKSITSKNTPFKGLPSSKKFYKNLDTTSKATKESKVASGSLAKGKIYKSTDNLGKLRSPPGHKPDNDIELIQTALLSNAMSSHSRESLVVPGSLIKGKIYKSIENLSRMKPLKPQKVDKEIESIQVVPKAVVKTSDTLLSKDIIKSISSVNDSESVSSTPAINEEEKPSSSKMRQKQTLTQPLAQPLISAKPPSPNVPVTLKTLSLGKNATPIEPLAQLAAVAKMKKMLSRKAKKIHSSQDSLGKSSGSGDQSIRSSIAGDYMPMQNEITEEEIINLFIKIFPTLLPNYRKLILKDIIGHCDPSDMKMLNTTIPRFHRDFLSLCNLKIVYRILEYVSPTDLITGSSVSKKWYQIMKSQELWYSLYDFIGLASMAKVFFMPNGSVASNANLFSSIYNWAHGIFSYRFFQAHYLGVLSMSFDGKTVATASSDMSAKVFSIKNGALLRTLTGHDGPIHSIQHDSEKVITGSNDCTIRIWDNHGKGNLLGIFKYHTKPITCLKLCNEMLISGSEDKTVRVWDLKALTHTNRESVSELVVDYDPDFAPTLLDLNGVIAPIPKVKKAKVVEVHDITDDDKCCQRTLHGHDHAIKALDMCDNLIISGDIRGYVFLWHISSGNCLNIIGFNHQVDHPIQIGFDIVTDMRKEDHPPILHEPISEIQYKNNRLLVSTLSGYAFMNDVNPLPKSNPDPLTDYTNFYDWAIDPSTFKQKPTFYLRDNTRNGIVQIEPHSIGNTLTIPNSINSNTLKIPGGTNNTQTLATGLAPSLVSPGPIVTEVKSNDVKSKGMMGKWTLCSKSDEWRLLTGGSQGYISVFNHRIGKFIYKLEPVTSSDSNHSSIVSVALRKGSFQDMIRSNKTTGMIRSELRQGSGSHTFTALDFDDSFIVGCGMDGKIHVWEPKPSVVNLNITINGNFII